MPMTSDGAPQGSWSARDVQGGISAAMISLPQSVGLGIVALAPLGPALAANGVLAGLMGAAVVGFLIPLFGGNWAMISGPRASAALVLAGVLAAAVAPGAAFAGREEAALGLAFATLVLAGGLQFLFGVLRLGGLIKYVPYPVVGGLFTGAAILIMWSQARILLGIPEGASALDVLAVGLRPLPAMILVAAVTVAVALIIPRRYPRLPGILLALVAGIALHYALLPVLGEAALGGTIGALGGGESFFSLPLISFWRDLRSGPPLPLSLAFTVLAGAVSIAALASLDTLLCAVTVDGATFGRTDGNRELTAHGLANTLAAAAGGLFSAGSLARTKFSLMAGARSRLASFTNAAVILAAAVVFPGALAHLPNSVVAGMLLVVGFELIDRWSVGQVQNLAAAGWRGAPGVLAEIGMVAAVAVAACAVGLVAALGIGVVIAGAVLVARLRRTLIRRVYRGTHVHSRRRRDRQSMEYLAHEGHRIAILELEGPVFFGGADQLDTEIDSLREAGARLIVLDMKRVTGIDASGARTLENLFRRAARAGVFVALSYMVRERRRVQAPRNGSERRGDSRPRKAWLALEQLGVFKTLGEDHLFADTDTALGDCENRLLAEVEARRGRDGPDRRALADAFADMSKDEVRQLRRLATRRVLKAGEVVFHEGDPGGAVYVLAHGSADVIIRVKGREHGRRVDTLTPGAVFGEMAVLDEKPRAASVVAGNNGALCYRMSAAAFAELKSKHPPLGLKALLNLCLIMSGRVRAANLMINELES